MARFERCCVYLSLIALLALIGSTFGPLIRDRSIPPTTSSEEELNANIDHIYQKDYQTPAAAAAAEGSTADQPLELVARSNPVGQREKKPIDANDKQGLAAVVRNNGELKVVFFNSTTPTPPTPPPAQFDPVVSHAPTKLDEILVLRAAGVNDTVREMMGELDVSIDSYPPNYPFEKIRRILESNGGMYSEVFEEELATEALVTRINSPSDQYLCSSSPKSEYPTYHPEENVNIVNVPGHYQHVLFELCDNVGAVCSNAIPASNGKLICEQVYAQHKMLVVAADGPDKFIKMSLRFPTCCKCRHQMT